MYMLVNFYLNILYMHAHRDQFFGFSHINTPVSDQLLFYGFLSKAKYVFKHTNYIPELMELSSPILFSNLLKKCLL